MSAPVTPENRNDGRPNPSAATVCKLWLRYSKRGKLRFASHRDVARVFERAVRRARIPVAHSQGFTPHPKLSWMGAAPTGTASEAEYLEIGLIRALTPQAAMDGLNAALPEDIQVLGAAEAVSGSLADRIDGSHWRITMPWISPAELAEAVEALRAAGPVIVARKTKSGIKDVDVAAALVQLSVSESGLEPSTQVASGPVHPVATESPMDSRSCGILDVVVRQSTPTVRPDDVLSALRVVADLGRSEIPAKAVRIAQGRLDDSGHLVDPLATTVGE